MQDLYCQQQYRISAELLGPLGQLQGGIQYPDLRWHLRNSSCWTTLCRPNGSFKNQSPSHRPQNGRAIVTRTPTKRISNLEKLPNLSRCFSASLRKRKLNPNRNQVRGVCVCRFMQHIALRTSQKAAQQKTPFSAHEQVFLYLSSNR